MSNRDRRKKRNKSDGSFDAFDWYLVGEAVVHIVMFLPRAVAFVARAIFSFVT